jgi:hypothetical protein
MNFTVLFTEVILTHLQRVKLLSNVLNDKRNQQFREIIMSKLLQVDFKTPSPFTPQMMEMMIDLAKSINNQPGMIWKIWTQKPAEQLGGGIYLFEDDQSAENYLEMHSARLSKMGITEIRGIIFDINEPLTEINKGPVK